MLRATLLANWTMGETPGAGSLWQECDIPRPRSLVRGYLDIRPFRLGRYLKGESCFAFWGDVWLDILVYLHSAYSVKLTLLRGSIWDLACSQFL
jgi:hypothetical protein